MRLLSCFTLAVAAAPLWAGVRIKVDVTDLASKAVTQQELLLDTGRMRMNMTPATGPKTSVLFLTDGGRNRIVMLDSERNEYREMDQQTMAQLSQQLQGAMSQLQAQLQNMPPEQRAAMEKMMAGRMGQLAGQGAAAPKTVYTARGSASANGFACTKYDGMRGAEKVMELCAAKPGDLHLEAADFQTIEKLRDFVSQMTAGLANSPLAQTRVGDWVQPGIEGFPVQSMAYSGGQATMRTDVKQAERASFSDADFSVGSAKKVDMPLGRRGR